MEINNQILQTVMEASFILVQILYGSVLSETAVYHVAFGGLMVSIVITAVILVWLLRKVWQKSLWRLWIEDLLTKGTNNLK